MSYVRNKLLIGALATAALVAGAVTALGSQTSNSEPATAGLFEKAAVGGRTGCEVQSWPYIAPECLDGGHAKSVRQL